MSEIESSDYLEEIGIARLKDGLRRDFGPTCMSGLEDPKVVEVMLNPDGKVWFDVLGGGMKFTGEVLSPAQGLRICNNIAALLDTTITRKNPIVEGELPLDGSRFEGLIGPIVRNPTFAIRKKASQVFSLEEFCRAGIITHMNDPVNRSRKRQESFAEMVKGKSHYEIIKLAVLHRKNILIVGPTGSGKTTLINGVLEAIAKLTGGHRIILIEDTGEIQCIAENFVQLRSTDDIDMTRLLRATMRLRPDRIIVGEVRGAEALALLKAWNTGHPGGLATVHANDARAGLVRLEQLVQEALPHVNRHLIAEAVDLVIFIEKEESIEAGRKVRELAVVERFDAERGDYIITHV